MSLVAKLTAREGNSLLRRTFEDASEAELTIEGIHFLTEDEDQRQYDAYMWLEGCSPDTFVAATESDETVETCQPVTAVGERHLVRIVTVPFSQDRPPVVPVFRENDITLMGGGLDREGAHLEVRLPDREALEALLAWAEQVGDEADLQRLYAETGADRPQVLTDKQRAALALASDRGYFAVPRETSLDALATDLDVSPQTLSRHIRVGVEKVVSPAVDDVDDPHELFKDTDE